MKILNLSTITLLTFILSACVVTNPTDSQHTTITEETPTNRGFSTLNPVIREPETVDRGFGVIEIPLKGEQPLKLYSASYALLIGESEYTDWPQLESIPRELEQVEELLKSQGFQVIKKLNLNSDELKQAFEDFINQYGLEPENRLLFFFSGHGHTRKNGDKGYIVPTDAPNPALDERGFIQKAVNMELIMTWARQIESKHALFLFDSCFSGTIFKSKSVPKLSKYIDKMVAKPVRQFISAGSADEVVPAKSVFTPAFIDAVREAKADFNQDSFVTGSELGSYLEGEVPKYEEQTPQFGKIKDYELAQGDFVFAVGDGSGQPVGQVGIDEDYYNSLETSALLSNAKTAYEKEDYKKALAIYSKAAKRKDGQLMDTYIGLYVTAKELDNSDIQEEAYAKFVEIAFANNRLSSLFLFEVNGTKFKSEKKDEYELWLRKIAEYLIENDKCFNIVGHDSKTRDREYSIKLSRQRAETIQAAMIRKFPQIAEKSKASGEGFDRCKVCSGTNDTKDEVDRRVEFTVVDCSEI